MQKKGTGKRSAPAKRPKKRQPRKDPNQAAFDLVNRLAQK